MSEAKSWTVDELQGELRRFERQLRVAGLAENSIKTYVERAETFIRWLADDYTPQGPRG